MTARSTVSDVLAKQALQVVECSIPEDMTIGEWRHSRPRSARRRPRRLRARTPAAARHLAAVPVPETTCDHLHDTTTRYSAADKLLTFLLVCHACGTEKVIETLPYEPRFERLEQHPVRLAA
jgi:hypothetical protein